MEECSEAGGGQEDKARDQVGKKLTQDDHRGN